MSGEWKYQSSKFDNFDEYYGLLDDQSVKESRSIIITYPYNDNSNSLESGVHLVFNLLIFIFDKTAKCVALHFSVVSVHLAKEYDPLATVGHLARG